MVRLNPNIAAIYLRQHKEVWPIIGICGFSLSWMAYMGIYQVMNNPDSVNFSRSQRGSLFKDYESRADSVRRASAHHIADDLGKLSVWGFERKKTEMR